LARATVTVHGLTLSARRRQLHAGLLHRDDTATITPKTLHGDGDGEQQAVRRTTSATASCTLTGVIGADVGAAPPAPQLRHRARRTGKTVTGHRPDAHGRRGWNYYALEHHGDDHSGNYQQRSDDSGRFRGLARPPHRLRRSTSGWYRVAVARRIASSTVTRGAPHGYSGTWRLTTATGAWISPPIVRRRAVWSIRLSSTGATQTVTLGGGGYVPAPETTTETARRISPSITARTRAVDDSSVEHRYDDHGDARNARDLAVPAITTATGGRISRCITRRPGCGRFGSRARERRRPQRSAAATSRRCLATTTATVRPTPRSISRRRTMDDSRSGTGRHRP